MSTQASEVSNTKEDAYMTAWNVMHSLFPSCLYNHTVSPLIASVFTNNQCKPEKAS